MAKRSRHTASEQTFLKHSFQQDSNNQTGYKQLTYEDSATVAADDTVHEYQTQGNVSSPSLATVSAAVANSSTNPFTSSYSKANGHSYRNGVHSYSNGFPSSSGQLVGNQPSVSGIAPSSSGHYAANISGVALSPNLSGKRQTLLDPSRSSAHVQASPTQLANESQFVQLLSTPKASPSPTGALPTCCNLACNGIRELLSSLALMCVLSLLMAFLALFFLQKSNALTLLSEESTLSNANTSRAQHRVPLSAFNQRLVSNAREYMRVFQISVCLSTLTIALDLCCLFVCCIQFLSIVKLIKTPFGKRRSFEFIKKTSQVRVVAIGAFLVSIPIFFTGVILYTFVNFEEIPALITSVIIGVGIIFCGVASVQNVYLWQWEKTKASEDMRLCEQASTLPAGQQLMFGQSSPPTYPLELSTLV